MEKKMTEHEAKIAKLREQLVHIKKESELEQAKIIARFKNEGLNNALIAFAFDVSTGDVCKLGKWDTFVLGYEENAENTVT